MFVPPAISEKGHLHNLKRFKLAWLETIYYSMLPLLWIVGSWYLSLNCSPLMGGARGIFAVVFLQIFKKNIIRSCWTRETMKYLNQFLESIDCSSFLLAWPLIEGSKWNWMVGVTNCLDKRKSVSNPWLSQANSCMAEWICFNMAAASVKIQLGEALSLGCCL